MEEEIKEEVEQEIVIKKKKFNFRLLLVIVTVL